MSEYDYVIEILEEDMKRVMGNCNYWESMARQTERGERNAKFWNKCLAQLESAIKRLKEE